MAQRIIQTPEGKTYAKISVEDTLVLNANSHLISGKLEKTEKPTRNRLVTREFGLLGDPDDVITTLNNLNRYKSEVSHLTNAAKRIRNLDEDY